MLSRLRSLWHAVSRRGRFEDAMADEMRFHMEAYAEDLVRSGLARAEAERRARLEFGGVEGLKEECRQARGLRLLDELRQDLRYAARQFAKTPGFTAAAVASLALGIGANTAIFTLMDAVLLRTLPVPRPQELFFLGHDPGPRASTSANYPIFERYKGVDAFSGVTAYRGSEFRVAKADGVEHVVGQFASGNYHAVLEVKVALGRGFVSEPDRVKGGSFDAVISDGYWERKFGRSPEVLGKPLLIQGRPFTIVGVTAPGFHGLTPGRHVDLTLPMSIRELDEPGFFDAHDGWISLTILGRLRSGVTPDRAAAAIDAVFQQFMTEPENVWARKGPGGGFRSAALLPADKGSSGLRRQYETPLRVLMAMVAVVLLIACANVANLLLARATARGREVALRMGIGAARARLIRQFLTESLVLALAGGAAGLLLAMWAAAAIGSLLVIGGSPVLLDVTPNPRILAFTIGVAMLTTLVFGSGPAFRATRVELAAALKGGSGLLDLRRQRPSAAGTSLVVAQIALSVLVVAGAGLLGRSLAKLRSFDAGFQRDNVLLLQIETPPESFSPERRASFHRDLLERLRTHPGVVSAAYSTRSPIDFSEQSRRFEVLGAAPTPNARRGVSANVVTPGYFQTFGIRLLRGRALTDDDRANTPRVAVVGTAMARAYFGERDPIGRTVLLGGAKESMSIVGIVSDVLHERLRSDTAPPMIYTPLAQLGEDQPRLTAQLRTRQDPAALQAFVLGEVRAAGKDAVVSRVRTMRQQVDAALGQERVLALLSSGFALLALLLACVGLFGVMSYNVARRTREIGVRIALGATRLLLMRRILRQTLAVAGAGIAIGIAATLASSKLVAAFLFGVGERDPWTLGSAAATLLLTALLAGYLPARRAASVDPMRALRAD